MRVKRPPFSFRAFWHRLGNVLLPGEADSDLLWNERMSLWNGLFAAISLTLVSSFLPLFAVEALHADDYRVALLSSLPQITSLLATFLGMVLLRVYAGEVKRLTLWSLLATRGLLAAFVLLPWLLFGRAADLLVLLVGVMAFPQALANLFWQALIGEIIPAERRNAFFSARNRWATLASMFAVLLVGSFMSAFDKRLLWPYQVFFSVALAAGLLEVYFLARHRVPSPRADRSVSPSFSLAELGESLRDPRFRRFLAAVLFFHFAWQMAWPLFTLYNVKIAHADAFWLASFTVTSLLGQLVTYGFWGRLAEARDGRHLLGVATLGMATIPALTVLSVSLPYLALVNLWTGLFLSGVQLLIFNVLLALGEVRDRNGAIALYNAGVGIIGFLAPQVGVLIAAKLGIIGAMWISSLLRALSALFLWMLPRCDVRSGSSTASVAVASGRARES
ncbi:MFS transporter [Brockia lithotrophica]|uniref:MFS transporter n=1 Tax=Brockia lithotrophica TaxID=933949 RepID=A0A660L0D7_9BACL|nr:MFS transporter [Brockia lithotrophica]RKQ84710.1 MFS transporter [Brockia lithotrophica]